MAKLHLLAVGWSRYERLPEPVRADLRTAAGWPWPSDVVLLGPKRWTTGTCWAAASPKRTKSKRNAHGYGP